MFVFDSVGVGASVDAIVTDADAVADTDVGILTISSMETPSHECSSILTSDADVLVVDEVMG
jgi:hypothetical protein